MANDTIVALATAPGEGAVAITRLSGPAALALAGRRFRGRRSPEASPTHRILHGTFLDGTEQPVDTVLLSVFRAPHSYTGEDVVEISSHGGGEIPRIIFEALVGDGARPARAGEFTERAYRNGKLDLAQAEAVAALVRARSERAARAARAALGGELSRRIEALDRALLPVLAEVEARLDFPGDVEDALPGAGLAARVGEVAGPIRGWLAGLPAARRRDQGLAVALVGRPNVGKSSLLNALLGYERAIVSREPGTTRDTVEASIWLDGLELRLTDTAGLRATGDEVERLGRERAERAARESDLAVLVLDRSTEVVEEDRAAVAAVTAEPARPVLVAWNKSDLARGPRPPARLDGARVLAEVETVAVRPQGAEALRDALREAARRVAGDAAGEELPTTSARQEALLREAVSALDRATELLRREGGPGRAGGRDGEDRAEGPGRLDGALDLIAADLTDARRALGEVVGRGVDDALLAAIFSQFCIGK